nr:hypothetical protein [Tanacetum cinerariifolium]
MMMMVDRGVAADCGWGQREEWRRRVVASDIWDRIDRISAENQTDKNAGPQDTNGNEGTQDNVDAGKEVSDQHYIVLPLWSSISSTYKSSEDKPADDKPKDDTGSKTVEEPANKEYQAYRDELDRLMSQEKEASDAADALRKEFKHECMDQKGVTQACSTNSFNTVSNPVNAASTSGTFSTGGPLSPHLDAFIPANTLLHVDQDESHIPDLEETTELQSTGIFNSAYDDDLDIYTSPVQSMGAESDFNNMESSTIFSPIPTHKVHMDHPKDQILGDPKSAVQTRVMAKKSSGAHALMEPKKVSLSAAGFSLYWWMKLCTTSTIVDAAELINSVTELHAIVDGKAVVISELSVRSDLLFNDKDANTSISIYTSKETTHKPRKAKKVTELPQTSVPLDIGADEAVHQEEG